MLFEFSLARGHFSQGRRPGVENRPLVRRRNPSPGLASIFPGLRLWGDALWLVYGSLHSARREAAYACTLVTGRGRAKWTFMAFCTSNQTLRWRTSAKVSSAWPESFTPTRTAILVSQVGLEFVAWPHRARD